MKHEIINSTVYTSQDPIILNGVKKVLGDLYITLLPVLRGQKELADIPYENIRTLFSTVLQPSVPLDIRQKMEYYAHKDLIMFHMTLDPHRINAVSSKNTLEDVEYVSNKIEDVE